MKNLKLLKKTFIYIAVLSVIAGSLVVPAYADSSNLVPYHAGVSDFPDQATAQEIYETSLIGWSGTYNGNNYGFGVFSPSSGDIFANCLKLGGTAYILCYTQDADQYVNYSIYRSNYGNPYHCSYNPGYAVSGSVSDVLGEQYEGSYYYYELHASGSEFNNLEAQLPLYTDLESGLYALVQSSGSSSSSVKRYEIPYGYAAYIKGTGSATLTCTQPYLSEWIGKPFPYSMTQTYGKTSSFYTAGDVLPDSLTGSSYIPWSKGQPQTATGRTYQSYAIWDFIDDTYLVLVNPTTMHLTYGTDKQYMHNNTIYITGNFSEFQLISLTDSIASGYLESTNADPSGTALTETVDDNGTISYTYTSSGDAAEVSPGGDTIIGEPEAGESTEAFLDNFVQRIINILTIPVSHIQSLVSAASDFFAVLSGLWSWLPPDIVSLYTSILVVGAVLGLIRLFWK